MPAEEIDALQRAGIEFQIAIAEEALADAPDDVELLRFLAQAYSIVRRYQEGVAMDQRVVRKRPRDPRARYNLACSLTLAGRRAEALRALERAVQLGFRDVELLDRDQDLAALRDEPGFSVLRDKIAGA